jgi:2-amino-4-hydroxy-6-hydroxymethyldihydropteridine diphosphokinase
MNRAVIGIGSNIDPEYNIPEALDQIGRVHRIISESKIVETKPIGFTKQPNFLNCALLIETPMDYSQLQGWLHRIEKNLGRIRKSKKYGPRTIDLDVVVWNGEIVDQDVYDRDFLLNNVLEVWPDLVM